MSGYGMKVEHYRGRLGYFAWKDGAETGREWFSGSIFSDNTRTHRAVCQLDGDWQVMRDVTVSLNEHGRALDCYTRLRRNDRFEGSAWFQFHDDHAVCHAETREYGRVTQQIPYAERPRVFTTHPVTCDGWVGGAYDHSNPQKTQRILRALHTSPTPDGSTGPLFGIWDLDITYQGEVEVTVPAGTFQTRHYSWNVVGSPWGPLETYVFGPYNQLARLTWDTLQHNFDLVEYETFT